MPKNKTEEIEAVILELLDNEPEVSIRLIAKELEVSKDDAAPRKAIGRALSSLVEQNLIVPKNLGRSRVYVKVTRKVEAEPLSGAAQGDAFKGIELSRESRSLLQYVSQGINERMPVGYNQEFLRSYEPNKTFYLTPGQRENLLKIGNITENRGDWAYFSKWERPGIGLKSILNFILVKKKVNIRFD